MREFRNSGFATPIVVVLVVIAFLMMTFDIRSQRGGITGTLRSGAQTLLAPIQAIGDTVIQPVVDFVDGVINLAGLRDENEGLREEIADLQAQLDRAEVDAAELDALRELLGVELPDEILTSTVARVLGSASNFDFAFSISKGSSDGVLVGNPVVDETNAVIGRVVSVTSNAAIVMPIGDPRSSVQVVAPSGTVGIAEGQGTGQLRVRLFNETQALAADSVLFTAGSDAFPPRLPVARVLRSESPEVGSGTIRAIAVPLGIPDGLDFVRVIQWPAPAPR